MAEAKLSCALLVEDDPDHAELIRMVLENAGTIERVDHAADGTSALDYLRERRQGDSAAALPGLVLLDLRLPGLSGVDVLREIKTDSKLKSLPVVVLTTSNRAQEIETCYRLGANSFVTKPVDFSRFEKCIGEIAVYWGTVNTPPAAADPVSQQDA